MKKGFFRMTGTSCQVEQHYKKMYIQKIVAIVLFIKI